MFLEIISNMKLATKDKYDIDIDKLFNISISIVLNLFEIHNNI